VPTFLNKLHESIGHFLLTFTFGGSNTWVFGVVVMFRLVRRGVGGFEVFFNRI
jgi:hypothetical protein